MQKRIYQYILYPLVVLFIAGFISRYVALSAGQYVTESDADAKYLTKEAAKLKYLTSLEYRDTLIQLGTLTNDFSHIKTSIDDINDYILHSSHQH